MAVSKESGFKKVAGIFDSGWKIIIVVVAMISCISSFTIAWNKIKENEARIQQVDQTYRAMILELVKDNKQQLEDQRELIVKNISRLSELKEKFNDHEISAAEFRGKVKTILKIN